MSRDTEGFYLADRTNHNQKQLRRPTDGVTYSHSNLLLCSPSFPLFHLFDFTPFTLFTPAALTPSFGQLLALFVLFANQLLSTFNSMIIPHIVLAKNRKICDSLPPVTKPTPRYHPTLQMASEEGSPPPSRALLSVRSKPTVILYRTFLSWASQDCSLTSREPKVRAFFFWEWFN